ncbi:hypothetical protein CZ797_10450 [Pseudoalteromonas sp. JB197]|nr:hypothetical protein CZ797_10450 [Pseudoalteromonas sp. JB197]
MDAYYACLKKVNFDLAQTIVIKSGTLISLMLVNHMAR